MTENKINRRLIITQGDITLLQLADGALVNPSNTGLILNSGVSAAIARRAGPFMQQTLHMTRSTLRNNRLEPGKAVATEAGQLQVKHLIHVAIMGAKKINKRLISHALLNAYDTADDLEVKQLAIPPFGYGLNDKVALTDFLELFWRITSEELPNSSHLEEVYLSIENENDYKVVLDFVENHRNDMSPGVEIDIRNVGFASGMFR